MATQVVSVYAFCVKRLSIIASSGDQSGQYQGDQVWVVAATDGGATAVLQAQYGADLGPVSGGGTPIVGAITTMTGS
jgi:hypothetical protein